LKKKNRPKSKAFYKKKGLQKRDIEDFRQNILQKSGAAQLKSTLMDSLLNIHFLKIQATKNHLKANQSTNPTKALSAISFQIVN
jgi:hypothetical protein